MKRIGYLALIIMISLGSDLLKAKTCIVRMDSQQDFSSGKLDAIAVTPDGRAVLTGGMKSIWSSEDDTVWSLAFSQDGSLFAGTGNDGKIYHIKKNETSSLIFDSPEIAILSLAMGPDGALYAGTAPDGLIYRIDPATNKPEVFFRTDAHYVWALEWSDRYRWVAATGDPSRIISIDRDGTERDSWSVEAEHVRCLATGKTSIWAGTSSPPVVYRIIGKDIDAVYEGDGEEISCIATAATGYTWFAIVPQGAISGTDITPQMALSPCLPDKDSRSSASVFRIAPDGSVEFRWSTRAVPVFAMTIWKDRPLVSCGGKGFLCRIDGIDRVTLMSTAKEQPITCLSTYSGKLYAGTGGEAEVLCLQDRPAPEGIIVSKVYDAQRLAQWGTLSWIAENGGSIVIETRSGNRKEPDAFWSDWAALNPPVNGGRIQSPPAQYFQWRATLSGGENRLPPQLDAVEFAKSYPNRAPYFKALRVYPVSKGIMKKQPGGGMVFRQVLDDGTHIEYRFPTKNRKDQGISKGLWFKLKGMRTIRWIVKDDDNDKLIYQVSIRPVGRSHWTLLEKELETPVFSFDSSVFPDGIYEIKITASDNVSNPENLAIQTEKISRPFYIDNTPPTISDIRLKRIDNTAVLISGKASGTGSRLKELAYSIDASRWFLFTSADHIIDSQEETFEVRIIIDKDIDRLFLKVTDEQENIVTKTLELSPVTGSND